MIVLVALRTQPQQETYVPTPQVALERCGYEQQAQAAERAQRRREQPATARSERATRQANNEAEAAQHRQSSARECEERLLQKADLAAQQQAAAAARNGAATALSLRWGSFLELFLLLLTIAVGVAAIVATTEESKAERAQSQEHFAAQRRASLSATAGVTRILRFGGSLSATCSLSISNVGGGPATHIGVQINPLTQDYGAKEDSELAAQILAEHNRPLTPGDILQPNTPPKTVVRGVPIPQAFFSGSGEFANFNVSGWVRYRFDGAARYHVTPFVVFVSIVKNQERKTPADPEFIFMATDQGTAVAPD